MEVSLEKIDKSIKELERQYNGNLIINADLNRTLVSFQANKKQPFYRWYKFKEGYSSNLVKHILNDLRIKKGKLIDPFAGSGTSLFTASELGINSVGIELMPIGQELIKTKKIIQKAKKEQIISFLKA
jgi:DNA modification methylase